MDTFDFLFYIFLFGVIGMLVQFKPANTVSLMHPVSWKYKAVIKNTFLKKLVIFKPKYEEGKISLFDFVIYIIYLAHLIVFIPCFIAYWASGFQFLNFILDSIGWWIYCLVLIGIFILVKITEAFYAHNIG